MGYPLENVAILRTGHLPCYSWENNSLFLRLVHGFNSSRINSRLPTSPPSRNPTSIRTSWLHSGSLELPVLTRPRFSLSALFTINKRRARANSCPCRTPDEINMDALCSAGLATPLVKLAAIFRICCLCSEVQSLPESMLFPGIWTRDCKVGPQISCPSPHHFKMAPQKGAYNVSKSPEW